MGASDTTARAESARVSGRSAHSFRAPALLIIAGLVAAAALLPIVYLLARVLTADATLLQQALRPHTLAVLANSALLALAVTSASIVIAVPLAWLTTATDLPGRRTIMVLATLPLAIPSYIGGYTVVGALGPRGALQGLLDRLFGVDRLPELYGFFGAWLTLTLFSYPYVLLSVRAGLRGLDPALEEASRSLGHSPWRTFRRVTLPQLRPSIAAGALLVALYTLSDFGAVSLLQFNSFSRAIYVQYRSAFNRDFAAVLSLMLVALTSIVLIAEIRSRGRARYHRSTAGSIRPRPIARLGGWRWIALLVCAAIIMLALVMPIGVIVFWLWRGLSAGEPLRLVWAAAWNSICSSALASGAAVLAALPVALLAVRFRSRVSSALEAATYAGYVLPGIVISLALVRFASQYAPWIYQTLALLIIAYTLRFLPQALGTIRSALLNVNPRIEEAARSLGHSPSRVALRVTLPLIRSGVLSGAALVFLTAMKELPTTLVLGPLGFKTLATSTWAAADEGFFARAAAPALMIVLFSALSMIFVLRDQPGTERRPDHHD